MFVAWKFARSPPTTYTLPPMRAAPTSWRAVARDARLTHWPVPSGQAPYAAALAASSMATRKSTSRV